MVLEEHGICPAVGSVDDAALGNSHAKEAHVVLKLGDLCPGAFYLLAREDNFSTHMSFGPVDQEDIVATIYLIDVGTFVAQALGSIPDQELLFAFEIKVPVEFAEIYLPVAIDDVDLILIEKEGVIVVKALDHFLSPGTLDVFCGVEIGLTGIVGDKDHVELSFVVSDRCGPHALAVDVTLYQTLGGRAVQSIEDMCFVLPVDQIRGLQDDAAGEEVHGSRYHVVDVADAYYVGIGKI